MHPLIITATPNICWLQPDVPYPHTPEEIVAEAQRCEKAGASIFHIHAEGQWTQVIQTLRQETGLIIQCGMSSLPIPARMEVWEQHADMISMIVSHHDEAFTGLDVHVLHPREELAEYMRLCQQYGVKPELEIWHAGSIWNMRFLIKQGLLPAPYFATLFFGWPGGSWSPPTLEEYLYRRRLMPENSIINVSIMGPEQKAILDLALLSGGHVRVGTEDYPYLNGRIAAAHELVGQIAKRAQRMGRKIATPDEARAILKEPTVILETEAVSRSRYGCWLVDSEDISIREAARRVGVSHVALIHYRDAKKKRHVKDASDEEKRLR
jgi:3-keto-5-aminohexanoate cleavage enzyme